MSKIVIIGMGPAGLMAGYQLLKKDIQFHFMIIEKRQEGSF